MAETSKVETGRVPAKVQKLGKRIEKQSVEDRLDKLNQLEKRNLKQAFTIAYRAYREKPLPQTSVTTPTTAAEWTRLRRWARRLVERHMPNLGPDNLYADVAEFTDDMLAILIQFADMDNAEQTAWPSDLLTPPETDRQWCQFYITLLQVPAALTSL